MECSLTGQVRLMRECGRFTLAWLICRVVGTNGNFRGNTLLGFVSTGGANFVGAGTGFFSGQGGAGRENEQSPDRREPRRGSGTVGTEGTDRFYKTRKLYRHNFLKHWN